MKKSAVTLLGVAVICIAFAAIFVKLSDASASIISMYRMLFASLLLIPIVYRHRSEFNRLSAREWLSLLIAGLFLALHFGFWFESLQLTSVASSTVILALQPIVAMIAAYLIYKERAGRTVVISVFISISGVLIISWGDFSFTDMSAFSGNILSFLSVIAVVCYFMIGQRSVKNLKHWVYSFIVFTFAGLFLLAFNLITQEELMSYPPREWVLFLMLAIFPTIAHVIFNALLDEVSPTTISMSMLLEPVGASLLAYMLLSETLDALQLIGGVIVLIGVYFFLTAQGKNSYI